MAIVCPVFKPLNLDTSCIGNFLYSSQLHIAVPEDHSISFYDCSNPDNYVDRTVAIDLEGRIVKLFNYNPQPGIDAVGIVSRFSRQNNKVHEKLSFYTGGQVYPLLTAPFDRFSEFHLTPSIVSVSPYKVGSIAYMNSGSGVVHIVKSGKVHGTYNTANRHQNNLFWVQPDVLACVGKSMEHSIVEFISTAKITRGSCKLLSTIKVPLTESITCVGTVSTTLKDQAVLLFSTFLWIVDFSKREAEVIKKIRVRNQDRKAQFFFLNIGSNNGAVYLSPYECIAFDGRTFSKLSGSSQRLSLTNLGKGYFTYKLNNRYRKIVHAELSNPIAMLNLHDLEFTYFDGTDVQLIHYNRDIVGNQYISRLKGYQYDMKLLETRKLYQFNTVDVFSNADLEPVSDVFWVSENSCLVTGGFGAKLATFNEDKLEFVESWYENCKTVYADEGYQVTESAINVKEGDSFKQVKNPFKDEEILMASISKNKNKNTLLVGSSKSISFDLESVTELASGDVLMGLFSEGFVTNTGVSFLTSPTKLEFSSLTCCAEFKNQLIVGDSIGNLRVFNNIGDGENPPNHVTLKISNEEIVSLKSYDNYLVVQTINSQLLYTTGSELLLVNTNAELIPTTSRSKFMSINNGVLVYGVCNHSEMECKDLVRSSSVDLTTLENCGENHFFWLEKPTEGNKECLVYIAEKNNLQNVQKYVLNQNEEYAYDYVLLNERYLVEIRHLFCLENFELDEIDELNDGDEEFDNISIEIRVFELGDNRVKLVDEITIEHQLYYDFSLCPERLTSNAFVLNFEYEDCFVIHFEDSTHLKPVYYNSDELNASGFMGGWFFTEGCDHFVVPEGEGLKLLSLSACLQPDEGAINEDDLIESNFVNVVLKPCPTDGTSSSVGDYWAAAISRDVRDRSKVLFSLYFLSATEQKCELLCKFVINESDAYVLKVDQNASTEPTKYMPDFVIGASSGSIYTVSVMNKEVFTDLLDYTNKYEQKRGCLFNNDEIVIGDVLLAAINDSEYQQTQPLPSSAPSNIGHLITELYK